MTRRYSLLAAALLICASCDDVPNVGNPVPPNPEAGRVRLEVTGPAESEALPDSAFRLSLIDPLASARLGSDDIALAAALTHWKTVERWKG